MKDFLLACIKPVQRRQSPPPVVPRYPHLQAERKQHGGGHGQRKGTGKGKGKAGGRNEGRHGERVAASAEIKEDYKSRRWDAAV